MRFFPQINENKRQCPGTAALLLGKNDPVTLFCLLYCPWTRGDKCALLPSRRNRCSCGFFARLAPL